MVLSGSFIYAHRIGLSRAVVAALGMLLFVYQGALIIRHLTPAPPPAVQVKLLTLPPPPVPQPVIPPKPIPALPKVKPSAIKPAPKPPTTAPELHAAPAPAVQPSIAMPNTPAVAVNPPVAEVPMNKSEAKPAVASMPKGNAESESGFARDVREKIEQQKVYPASARELGMAGEVEVRYVLDRKGHLLDAEVINSSGYPLLDRAALRAVRTATFKAMQAESWPDASQKEFRTKMVFSITD